MPLSLDPNILIIAIIIGSCWFIYKKTRRITKVIDLTGDIYGKCLSGVVTSVTDGDGFRFFHVPWFRSSEYTASDPKLTIRLAGIDAPESGFFGMTAQPFSKKAKEYLSDLVLGKTVCLKLIKIDRYHRLLAVCFVKKYFMYSVNVNLKMVEDGLACVYVGTDAEYDEMLDDLERAEVNAKHKKLGMWIQEDYVSPMEHKKKWREVYVACKRPTGACQWKCCK